MTLELDTAVFSPWLDKPTDIFLESIGQSLDVRAKKLNCSSWSHFAAFFKMTVWYLAYELTLS